MYLRVRVTSFEPRLGPSQCFQLPEVRALLSVLPPSPAILALGRGSPWLHLAVVAPVWLAIGDATNMSKLPPTPFTEKQTPLSRPSQPTSAPFSDYCVVCGRNSCRRRVCSRVSDRAYVAAVSTPLPKKEKSVLIAANPTFDALHRRSLNPLLGKPPQYRFCFPKPVTTEEISPLPGAYSSTCSSDKAGSSSGGWFIFPPADNLG